MGASASLVSWMLLCRVGDEYRVYGLGVNVVKLYVGAETWYSRDAGIMRW